MRLHHDMSSSCTGGDDKALQPPFQAARQTRGHGAGRLLALMILLGAQAGVFGHPQAASAHEYWIDPVQPIAPLTARLTADARVGQFFNGDSLPWLPDAVQAAGVIDAMGRRPNARIIGDMPMFDAASRVEGAQILFLQTRPETLTWDSWEKFLAFLEEKKLHAVAELHRRRGLPDSGFTEHYVRHAKALLWRGHAASPPTMPDTGKPPADRVLGLKLELVALDDPFNLPRRKGMLRIRLLWQGQPLAKTDVQVFSRPAGQRGEEARPRHFTSNVEGIVSIPVEAGRDYLVNAVHMEPALPSSGKAAGKAAAERAVNDMPVWVSHWASLTFTTRTGSGH